MTRDNREVKHITQNFEDLLVKLHDEYIAALDKFSSYRGQLITADNHKEIDQALLDIQIKFNTMWPMLHYIKNRYETTLNVESNYAKFIQEMRAAGILADVTPEKEEAKA